MAQNIQHGRLKQLMLIGAKHLIYAKFSYSHQDGHFYTKLMDRFLLTEYQEKHFLALTLYFLNERIIIGEAQRKNKQWIFIPHEKDIHLKIPSAIHDFEPIPVKLIDFGPHLSKEIVIIKG